MIKCRIFAFILMFVLVFNIFKYQIPHIQYGIFKDYIAKNLCVKKEVKNNCCHGKCFLKKQIKNIDENENSNPNTNNNNKKTQNNEVKEFLRSHVLTPKPVEIKLVQPVNFKAVILQGHALAVFVPPKIQNCNSIIINSFL
jgi:hypothetical protein